MILLSPPGNNQCIRVAVIIIIAESGAVISTIGSYDIIIGQRGKGTIAIVEV